MNAFVNYLLEANLGLCLFLLLYWILLRGETDFAVKEGIRPDFNSHLVDISAFSHHNTNSAGACDRLVCSHVHGFRRLLCMQTKIL